MTIREVYDKYEHLGRLADRVAEARRKRRQKLQQKRRRRRQTTQQALRLAP